MVQWVIACNTKKYNVVGVFEKLDTVDWKQSTNVKVGDEVYIYIARPIKAISYKCKVLATDLIERGLNDLEFVLDDSNFGNYGRYMRLKLVSTYNDPRLGYQNLKENGLKQVQGPSKVSAELATYLSTVLSTIG